MGRNPSRKRKGPQPRNEKGQYASYEKGTMVPPLPHFSESSKRRQEKVPDSIEDDFSDNFKGPVEISSDSMENVLSSDDDEALLDEVDEAFDAAKKQMCDAIGDDPSKNKKIVLSGLDTLYQDVVGVSLVLKKMGRSAAPKKK